MPKDDESFFKKVYQVVRLIPKGRVTSYGAIARYLGTAKSSRMVGWAMNSSGSEVEYVPAHRVVNRNGLLTGKQHFTEENAMEKSLKKEGIKVVENQIQDFDKVFWDPSEELNI